MHKKCDLYKNLRKRNFKKGKEWVFGLNKRSKKGIFLEFSFEHGKNRVSEKNNQLFLFSEPL